ncbi:MAG TPA: rhomboid family intramembrane serine protease [Methylomirabilota bacterium]|nr:rhomboid family intramembrane serine protease [Methylomirabilota bacterium]
MDDPRPPASSDPSRTGRLSRDEAAALLADADAALAAGDFRDAGARYGRVIGFDDPSMTAAALLGLGEARYRMGDEDAALATWEAATKLAETASTYTAWRNVAAARVRGGDLQGAIQAYREADLRAPAEDKPEIATRLGWLNKEAGDPKAARRYFARGRGEGPLISVTMILIAASVIVSLSALWSAEGGGLFDVLQLDKAAVAAGEYWRFWTVTLLHVNEIHLGLNMYALYLCGTIVERWYGSVRMLVFYLVCAAAGSIASFVFGGDVPSVGASGAVFGLVGLLLAAARVHHPVDRRSRGFVGQLGMLVIVNLVIGFAGTAADLVSFDNAAHVGGLAAGLWLGALIPPTRVQTLGSLWQRGRDAAVAHRAVVPLWATVVAVGVVAIVVVVGLIVGTAARVG